MTTLPQPLLRYLAAPGPDRASGRHCFDARGRSAQRLVVLGLAEKMGARLYRVTGRGLVVAAELEKE